MEKLKILNSDIGSQSVQDFFSFLKRNDPSLVYENQGLLYCDAFDYQRKTLKVKKIILTQLNQNDFTVVNILHHIDGNLEIAAETLPAINGFNQLCSVKRLKIHNMSLLEEINGFNSLEEIESLEINGNQNLKNIGGFSKFFSKVGKIPGYLKIIKNKKLTNIAFLYGLQSVGSSFYLHHNGLTSLSGLEKLQEVHASFSLSGNPLTDLLALSSLKYVHGMLGLVNNKLYSLEGLNNLESIGLSKWNGQYRSLAIHNNTHLNDLSALSKLSSTSNQLIIFLNRSNRLTKLPAHDSIFYQQEIKCFDSKHKEITVQQLFPEYRHKVKPKVLFYNKWKSSLSKSKQFKSYFSDFINVEDIIHIIKRHNIRFLFAQTYKAQKFIYHNQTKLRASGIQFLVNDLTISKLMLNKRKFYDHMIKNGFEKLIPDYFTDKSLIKYPCVIKRETGTSGKNVRIVYEETALGTILSSEVVNAYIPGDNEYAANIFYKNGKILFDVTYKKTYKSDDYILNRKTRFEMTDKIVNNAYLDYFTDILNSFFPNEVVYLCCIDYKVENDLPKIFEINTRLGYTLVRDTPLFNKMFQFYLDELSIQNV